MSEKITNSFTFYGNASVKKMEQELIAKFIQDLKIGNNEGTAVKRLMFGLQEDSEFAYYDRTGSNGCWYHDTSTHKFVLISKQEALYPLQDYMTQQASKFDKDVVVQMDYIGNTPQLVGTRLTYINEEGLLNADEAEENLDNYFCGEDEIDETTEYLEELGRDPSIIMAYEELEELKNDLRKTAIGNFNLIGGKAHISLD